MIQSFFFISSNSSSIIMILSLLVSVLSLLLLSRSSLPRCSCDDLCWFWVFDDVFEEIWLHIVRYQHVPVRHCYTVGVYCSGHRRVNHI